MTIYFIGGIKFCQKVLTSVIKEVIIKHNKPKAQQGGTNGNYVFKRKRISYPRMG